MKKLLAGNTITKKCKSKAGKEYTGEFALDTRNGRLAFASELEQGMER